MKRLACTVLLAIAGSGARAADITVSAAASLGNALRAVAQAYQAGQPGDRVLLNFAASDALAAQIAHGAPVDLFASADQDAMDKAQPYLLPGSRRNFASNRLVVALPVASTVVVHTLADLRQPAIRSLSTGNPASVPAGRYARAALEHAGLWAALETRFVFATNVRQSLDYLARGEVDAGLVYVTDLEAQAGKVRAALMVPTATPITYPLALLREAPNPAGARRFADFLLSPGGQAILARHGFGKP